MCFFIEAFVSFRLHVVVVRVPTCADNSLGAEGGVAVAEALKINSTLTSINLSRAHLHWCGDDDARMLMLVCSVSSVAVVRVWFLM